MLIFVNYLQTPLGSASADVSVFCLSLMGTNYQTYLEEACRVLKPGYVFLFLQRIFLFNLACFPRQDLTYCSIEQWLAFDSRSEEQI